MRHHVFYLSILILCTGCGNSNNFLATPPNQQGPVTNTTIGTIGSQGGTVASADGSVSFRVEPGVFPQDTVVTLTTSAPYARSGPQLVSNVCQLQLNPAPPETLDPPPQLTFLNTNGSQDTLVPCQQRLFLGQPTPESDPLPPGLFVPGQRFFGFNQNNQMQLELPLLHEQQVFCTASPLNPSSCQPSAEDLTPPTAPSGTTYIGREVVVNGVYVPGLSTVPIDRKSDPSDTMAVRSETRVVDGAVDCDIVVVHIFAQPGKETCGCEIPADMLVPPPTPAGYRPIGYTVVKNFVTVENTADLRRVGLETDINVIRSRTVVVDLTTECDIIVAFDFEQLLNGPELRKEQVVDSTGGEVDLGLAAPVCLVFPPGSLPVQTQVSLELVDPLLQGSNVLWPVVELSLNPQPASPLDPPPILHYKTGPALLDPLGIGHLIEDPGTVFGGSDPFARYLPQPSAANEDGGISGPVPVPDGVFALVKPKTCTIPAQALAPPPTPNGQKYLGREVVCNFVYDENLSTLPLDRGPAPTDSIFIESESILVDGVLCDYIVAHYFEPDTNDQQCIPPNGFLTPPPAPPGTQFVGYDLVLNFKIVESTVDLNRTEKATDTNVIRSSSTVGPDGQLCDFIVRFLFEPTS